LASTSKWKNKIIELVRDGKIREALAFSSELARKKATQNEIAEFLDGIGIILGKEKGEYEGALLIFDVAIQLARNEKIKEKAAMNCSVTHSILGNIFGKKGRFGEAEFHFKEALRLYPKLSIAHSEYGYLLNLLKRYDEADVQFKEALKLEPNNAQAHINYAILLDNFKRSHDAIFHCEEALRLDPNNPIYHVVYGIALMNCKRFDEAEFHFRKALVMKTDLIMANFGYGKLLTDLERFSEAKAYFKKTLELDPLFPDASINYDYAILMEISAHPLKKITKEWLAARRRSLKLERQKDLKDFELQEKHRKEWKILYDKFECLTCGRCCKRTEWITNIDLRLVWEDIERWRKEGRDDILKYVYVYEGLGGDFFDKKTFKRFSKCPFLKKEGKIYSCSIHETKPRGCKLFPFYFDNQGTCENCGATVKEEDVYCENCGLFLKANPGAYNCPGMKRTLKSLGLYRKVRQPILDLIGLAFRRG